MYACMYIYINLDVYKDQDQYYWAHDKLPIAMETESNLLVNLSVWLLLSPLKSIAYPAVNLFFVDTRLYLFYGFVH